jgi:cytochrome c oxidase assembly factor CtaG
MAGLTLTAAAIAPPVSDWTQRTLTLHMTVQMLLLALIGPLLAYGACPLLARRHTSVHPLVGIVTLNVVVFGAQLPPVVDAEAASLALHEAVIAAFLAGALIFWCPIVGNGRLSSVAKIGVLMVAGVPPTIPGVTLALSHHLFYAAYRSIEDQQVAGLLLFGTAKLALVGGTFVVLWRLLTPDIEPDDRDFREAPVEDIPPTGPAWLRRLDDDLPAEVDRPRVPAGSRR